jgi:hypothetical protein
VLKCQVREDELLTRLKCPSPAPTTPMRSSDTGSTCTKQSEPLMGYYRNEPITIDGVGAKAAALRRQPESPNGLNDRAHPLFGPSHAPQPR